MTPFFAGLLPVFYILKQTRDVFPGSLLPRSIKNFADPFSGSHLEKVFGTRFCGFLSNFTSSFFTRIPCPFYSAAWLSTSRRQLSSRPRTRVFSVLHTRVQCIARACSVYCTRVFSVLHAEPCITNKAEEYLACSMSYRHLLRGMMNIIETRVEYEVPTFIPSVHCAATFAASDERVASSLTCLSKLLVL